ncbi:NAD(P)-dependent oxidoreductase [Burkholderia sp. Bp9143]|uniref:NAD(P)-dependent oxidoreductase n=1 Tax=Burkholderia sp. Bp9143 TaxID=2184574 RepID=UPI002893624B|nr:NAD(P)-dependent oxidoreductase [Burkholderia sp. Bp9143]
MPPDGSAHEPTGFPDGSPVDVIGTWLLVFRMRLIRQWTISICLLRESRSMKIGYVGLGAMGRALAGNLAGGHDLLVWDLNPTAIQTLVEQGARAAISLADVGANCDVVVLCLPKSDNVRDALFGSGGLAETLKPGTVVIDQTSGLPDDTRSFVLALSEKGVGLVDAPVAGGVPAALAGQITIMASGSDAAFEQAYPVLVSISPKVFRCGQRVGDAQALKAINNMANAACRMMTLEVVAVGRKLGLTAAAMTEALNAGEARSFITERMLPAVVEGRSSTNFALGLMVKDLNQAALLGSRNALPMPISDVARGMINAALNLLGEQARLDDVVPFMESLTGTKFVGDAERNVRPLGDHAVEADAMRLVTASIAACNRFIMLENAALAVKVGLDVSDFAPVINSGSASSAEAESLFDGLLGRGQDIDRTVGKMLDCLTRLTQLGSGIGVPMLMTNQIRAQCLQSVADVGANARLTALNGCLVTTRNPANR